MKCATDARVNHTNGKWAFGIVTKEVFSLGAAIRWLALEEAGQKPRWAYRDPASGDLRACTTTHDAELVDPLLFLAAEGPAGLYSDEGGTNSHRLRFVVLAHADLVQIVARLGRTAYITVAIGPETDAYALGTRLANLLEQQNTSPVKNECTHMAARSVGRSYGSRNLIKATGTLAGETG